MHKPIIRINELKKFLIRFRVIETILDAAILFLSLFLILSFAGVSSIWALLLPPVLFLLVALRYRASGNMIKLIENRYPSLRERLGALYASREEKNVVVDDLAASIDSEMERVKFSSFISTGRLGLRVAVILLLVTLVLSFSIINPPGAVQQPGGNGVINKPETTGNGKAPDIFEEPSVVKIGNDSKGVLIYSSRGSEPNIRGEEKPVSGYSTLFPPDATSSGIYSEAIPAVYQTIVKNYFTNLSMQD